MNTLDTTRLGVYIYDMSTTEITKTSTDEGIRYQWIDEGVEVGYLLAHESGLILNVEVDQGRQGEGIARMLFEAADAEMGLLHAPDWGRTPDGDAFATAMGGDTMDEDEAAKIVGFDTEGFRAAMADWASR